MSSGTSVAELPAARTASSSLFQRADGARHGDDMGAGARQRQRTALADAARGAGDERDPIGERLRHASARLGEQRELARRRVLRGAVGERRRDIRR